MYKSAGTRIGITALLLLSFVLPLSLTLSSALTSRAEGITTADQIKAGYERRKAKLLAALIEDPGGNLWHAASKALASIYQEPVPPVQALINMEMAAGADPKCEECCAPPEADQCGYGAGYWSLPLLIRAYYLFHPGSTFENGRYAGRIPAKLSDQIKGFYRSYLNKGAGKGYGNCGRNAQPRCAAEYTITRYDSPPYAYISQSDNHTTIQAGAILLATQMLRGESAEYAQLYDKWRVWWSQFLDGLAKRGFWETASPTYVERHLAPIYNLYDFAEDGLIKKKAEMLLDWYWAEIAPELLHGVRGGAKMRVYGMSEGDRGALSAANDTMYGAYYLYFGDSVFEDNPLMPNAEMYSSVFATSSYQPSDVILELGANPQARGSFEIKERRKGSCFVWDQNNVGEQPYNSRRYAYVTPDYILGNFQTDADKQFMPSAEQNPDIQNSLVFATSPQARISWGEQGYLSSSQINVFQHKNVVIASKVSHPELGLASYLPPAGILDHVETEGEWLFIQEGNAYAAIRLVYNEILIIEAARSSDYGNDFAKFKAAVKQTHVGLIPSNIDAGFVEYTAANREVMWFPLRDSGGTCRYGCTCNPADEKLPKVNGQPVDWKAYPLFASPYVHAEWDSGLIEVVFNGRRLRLDFRDPDRPAKTETRVSTPTPTGRATPTSRPTVTSTATRIAWPSPTLTRTSAPTQGPGETRTPTAAAEPTPTPPIGGEPDNWLGKLLRAILDWINKMLRMYRDWLPSDYRRR